MLGVTLSCDLKWNDHVSEVIKKANEKLYFLVLLKSSCEPQPVILSIFPLFVTPVPEYCSPIFRRALPEYISNDIERVQKRALSIVLPELSYSQCLYSHGLETWRSRRSDQYTKLYNVISSFDHELSFLLPPKHENHCNLRGEKEGTTFLVREPTVPALVHPSNVYISE